MKRTMMMIGTSLLIAACGGSKADGAYKVDTASAEFREARVLSRMKMDLLNLVTTEETYFNDHMKYTANVKSLAGGLGFLTPGNSISPITLVGGGWTATIQNPNTRQVCAIFVGTKTPIPPATKEGVPACR